MFDSYQWILLNIFYAKSVLHSLDMENDTLRISRKLCSSLISIFRLIFPLTVKTERLIKCLSVWLGWVWLGLCTEYEESDWRIQWLCWVWLVFNDYAESTWQILWISWVWLVVFNEYAGSDSALMNTIGPNRCTTKSLRRKPNQKKCIQESTSESGWNSFQEKIICLSMNLYLLSLKVFSI